MYSIEISLTIILMFLAVPITMESHQNKEINDDQQIINRYTNGYQLFNAEISQPQQNESDTKNIFNKIEEAFSSADAGSLRSFLSSKIYLNFFTGENGYFSSNQTYFILKKFFNEHKALSFSYNNISASATNPYAIGQYQYIQRGAKAIAQVYISLHQTEHGWRINQITLSQRM